MNCGEMAMGPFTLERFQQLPGLVTRAVFLAWTGYSDREVTELERLGEIGVWRSQAPQAKRKFRKRDIARVCGFPYEVDECAGTRIRLALPKVRKLQRVTQGMHVSGIQVVRGLLRELHDTLG